MRNLLLALLIPTLLRFNVSAQVTSVKEYPAQFNDSRQVWEEVAENQGPKSIVAIHSTFDCPSISPMEKSGRHGVTSGGFDVLSLPTYVEPHRAIPPGGVTTLFAEDPSRCAGGVDAVVFSDGHSEGNSRWVNQYQQGWRGVHDGVIESLPLLAKVASREADLAELEDVLRQREESIPKFPLDPNGTFDWRRIGERLVYTDLELLLHSVRDSKAAFDSTPQPQPRSEEDQANGMWREQSRKLAVYLVNKLQDWKTGLENGLGPPAAR